MAVVATWFGAWELYDSMELWQLITNVKYQNYVILGMIVEFGVGIIALVFKGNKQATQPQQVDVKRKVEDFERSHNTSSNPGPDPPEDLSFSKLVARVDAVENEQKKQRQDIENIRNFAKLLPQHKEEAKPDV